MQHNPAELKLFRLLFGLTATIILSTLLVFGSLTAHHQYQQKLQLQHLFEHQQNLLRVTPKKQLEEMLTQEWSSFKIHYPNIQFALVHSASQPMPEILFSTLGGNDDRAQKIALQQTLNRLQNTSPNAFQAAEVDADAFEVNYSLSDSSIIAFIRQQWRAMRSGEQLYIQSFDAKHHWFFVVYQPQHWLPNFAVQGFKNTFWVLLGFIILAILAFFVTLRTSVKHFKLTQQRYQQFIDHNLDWVWEVDRNGIIIYSSEHSYNLLGIDANQLLGQSIFTFIDKNYHPETVKSFQKAIKETEPFFNFEIALKHPTQKIVYGVFYGQPFFDQNQMLGGFRGTCRNITAFKERNNLLLEKLHFDPVTQLPNRAYLLEHLNDLYQKIAAGQHFALLMLDLHDLQEVNDFHGHRYSTLAIHLSAERIRNTVAHKNLVCRLNGTEFAVLIRTPEINPENAKAQCELLAEELLFELKQPMVFGEHSFKLIANIGIALIPNHGNRTSQILAAANQALYDSKKHGYGRYRFATTDPVKTDHEHQATLAQLEKALSQHEFRLQYHLQIDTQHNHILAFEAFLRWKDPVSKKIVPAGEFVHIAEEHNKIYLLDEWVLSQLFEDWLALKEALNLEASAMHNLPSMVMNLSSDSLLSETFKHTLLNKLSQTGLPASKLRFEIAEDQLMRHANRAVRVINELSALGIKFSINQFATGWSNLSYLQSLPIEFIKLDRSQTIDMASNPQHLALVQTLVQMAHSLHLDVIAEGVETEIQQQLLQQIGCWKMQGYLFSQPFSATQMLTIIEHHKS